MHQKILITSDCCRTSVITCDQTGTLLPFELFLVENFRVRWPEKFSRRSDRIKLAKLRIKIWTILKFFILMITKLQFFVKMTASLEKEKLLNWLYFNNVFDLIWYAIPHQYDLGYYFLLNHKLNSSSSFNQSWCKGFSLPKL